MVHRKQKRTSNDSTFVPTVSCVSSVLYLRCEKSSLLSIFYKAFSFPRGKQQNHRPSQKVNNMFSLCHTNL